MSVPAEKVPISETQQSRAKRIWHIFSRFMQSCDPRYIEVETNQGLYRVKVDDLRRALDNAPSPPGRSLALLPEFRNKEGLRRWLQGQDRLMVSTVLSPGQPRLVRQQRKQWEEQGVYSDLAISRQTKKEQQQSVESLYNFLSEEGKKKLNLTKLKNLNVSQLKKLSDLLYEEFSLKTKRGERIYKAVRPGYYDEVESLREIVDRVNAYRQIVKDHWKECFREGGDEAKKNVLGGREDELETVFVLWWIREQSQQLEDEEPGPG